MIQGLFERTLRSLLQGHFDAAHYLAQNPDITQIEGDPLRHFLEWGWREGLNPGPDFDVAFYLESYSDVAASGMNPLLHFVLYGRREGRRPHPDATAPDTTGQPPPPATQLPDPDEQEHARRLAGGFFDEAYYRAQNPDLAPAGGDAFLHFLVWGWREGLSPGPDFDTSFYLQAYPDVAAADLNPLLHFLRHGQAEGRMARLPIDLWRAALDNAWAARARARQTLPPIAPSTELSAFAGALNAAAARRGLAIVISHDDYAESIGGVQNVIGDERLPLQQAGWGHLHIRPPHTIQRLADPMPIADAVVLARLNGEKCGALRMTDLVAVVAALRDAGRPAQVIIHHLAGSVPEHLIALIAAAGVQRSVVWVHDFFTLCTSHALLRNSMAYCGAPPQDSMACFICAHGPTRAAHLARLDAFFTAIRPDVLAPSDFALATWKRMGLPHNHAAVVPLARLELEPCVRPGPGAASEHRPVRIAHLGPRSLLKGWATFERLVERFADDMRYSFFQLGTQVGIPPHPAVHTTRVDVLPGDRDAMVRAIRENDIDIVICWSICAETFCFTAHEALAAGSFVLARHDAGNLWPAIAAIAPDQGLPLETEADLFALFEGDTLPALLARPRLQGRLRPGRGAVDWLEPRATNVLTPDHALV